MSDTPKGQDWGSRIAWFLIVAATAWGIGGVCGTQWEDERHLMCMRVLSQDSIRADSLETAFDNPRCRDFLRSGLSEKDGNP